MILEDFVRTFLLEISRYQKETGKKPAEEFVKEIQSFVTEHPCDYAFTMTDVNKIGINPRTDFDTPAGVYFYPLNAEYFERFMVDKPPNILPFANNRKYFGLVKLEPVRLGNWLYVGEGQGNQDIRDLRTVVAYVGDDIWKEARDGGHHFNMNYDSKIFDLTYMMAKKSGRLTTKWTQILRELGYDGIYDPGYKVLHPGEPQQIVAFTPRAYEVVQIFDSAELRRAGKSIVQKKEIEKVRTGKVSRKPEDIEVNLSFEEILKLSEDDQVAYFTSRHLIRNEYGALPIQIVPKNFFDKLHYRTRFALMNTIYSENIVSAFFSDEKISKGDLNLSRYSVDSLPSGLVVEGDLKVNSNTGLRKIGRNVKIKGNAYLSPCVDLVSIGENFYVEEDLHISASPISSLPRNLEVGKNFYLFGCENVRSIPPTIKIGGGLDLSESGVSILPDNFTVPGDLGLEDSEVRKLPNNLTVGGTLKLGSKIKSLPSGLNVYTIIIPSEAFPTGSRSFPKDMVWKQYYFSSKDNPW